MGEIDKTFTKTVGKCSNSFGIFQIKFDKFPIRPYNDPWSTADGDVELGINLSLLRVNQTTTEPTQCIHQYISADDLRDLWRLLYNAQCYYESRTKEIQEANKAREAEGKAKT